MTERSTPNATDAGGEGKRAYDKPTLWKRQTLAAVTAAPASAVPCAA